MHVFEQLLNASIFLFPGIQVTTQFKQTMTFFKPLYRDLAKRRVPGDMLAGLWMIVDAIRNRNYLYAYDIYMRLAIGARCYTMPRF